MQSKGAKRPVAQSGRMRTEDLYLHKRSFELGHDLNISGQVLMTSWVSSLLLPDCGGMLSVIASSKLPVHQNTGN